MCLRSVVSVVSSAVGDVCSAELLACRIARAVANPDRPIRRPEGCSLDLCRGLRKV